MNIFINNTKPTNECVTTITANIYYAVSSYKKSGDAANLLI